MNTEEFTIGLISDYKYAGFKEEDIEQRKVFLAVLAFILVSKTHEDYLDEVLLQGVDHLCCIESEIAMLKQSHQALLDEIKGYYAQARSLTERVFESLLPSVTNTSLHGITKLSALEIYDRTLQRLQKMNVEDNLSRSFRYDYFPVELAELVIRLTESKNNIHLAELFGADGRFTCMCSALSDTSQASVVAEKQSPTYIKHMLTITGVSSSDVFASSKDVNGDFDVSILLQPNSTNDDINTESAINDQLHSLNDNGVAIAIVGRGFLTVEQHKEFRISLIENGNVKSVIELPKKLLSPNTPQLFALVLCKSNPSTEVSFWYHGEHYLSKGRINILSLEGLIAPENAHSVNSTTVRSKNASLMPRSYAQVGTGEKISRTREARKKLLHLQEKNDRQIAHLGKSL